MLFFCTVACSEQTNQNKHDDWQLGDEVYLSFVNRANEIASAQEFDQADVTPKEFIVKSAPFEYWQWMAVLFDEAGNPYAFQQRFVRLRIKAESTLPDSKWDFSEVMALDHKLAAANSDAAYTQRQAQRVALSLAGADSAGKRVWLGAFSATEMLKQNCSQLMNLNSPRLALTFSTERCSRYDDTKNFTRSYGTAMPVTGKYFLQDGEVTLTGHGWFTHGWGVPPASANNAVLLDRAWFLLDQQEDIQLLRTRRRSGRGQSLSGGTRDRVGVPKIDEPAVAQTKAHETRRQPTPKTLSEIIEVQWVDVSSTDVNGVNGQSIPLSWQLTSESQNLNLNISPLHPKNHSLNVKGMPWFEAVVVQGSHDGIGFIEYSAN